MSIDKHRMIVLLLEEWFDLSVKVAEESCDRTGSLYLEEATKSVSVTVKVATLVTEFFVPMRGVKLVVFLDDQDSFR